MSLTNEFEPVEANSGPLPDQETMMDRSGQPEIDPAALNHIQAWEKRINHARGFHKKAFSRMRQDMTRARLGADGSWVTDGNYVANILQRHVNQKVATLYAKNPKARVKRRNRLMYRLWDGKADTLQLAMQAALAGDPNAMAIVQEVEHVKIEQLRMERLGKTLEIIFHYYLDEQEPNFKSHLKQLVRRALVTGVGYVKVGFQREFEKRPEVSAQIVDLTSRIARIEALTKDIADGELDEDAPEVAELQVMLRNLQEQEEVIVREGLVADFPGSTQVIVDPACRNLLDFVGASWLVDEMLLDPEEIKEVYGVDVGKNFKARTTTDPDGEPSDRDPSDESDEGRLGKEGNGKALVWEVWDKKSGTTFTVAEGFPGYLKAPEAPDVELERFFPFYTLIFNNIEDEEEIYPYGDIRLLWDMQLDYNRARQGLREQRWANRPKYATVQGRLSEGDLRKLEEHPSSAVLELEGLTSGEKVEDLIQRMPLVPIDPALYETGSQFEDVLRVAGQQEANIGGTSGDTATESSIAEGSRMSSVQSNVDDLDTMLTLFARGSGQVLMQHLSIDEAQRIAGPGAVWPEFSRGEIMNEVVLEIKAGSSGKPNKAAELANLERATPLLIQTPNINPTWLARKALERLDDDDLDLEEAIVEGMPSIIALNAAAQQPSTGDPADDPAQQGGRGGEAGDGGRNAEEPGGQPAFPAGGGEADVPGLGALFG